jgi:uncharacterized delta-60 repeat protein
MTRFFSRSTRRSSGNHTHRRFAILERLEPRIAMDGTGVVITDIENGSNDIGFDIQLQADGKLVAGGSATRTVDGTSYQDSALVRYNADGTLDTNFSGDGKMISGITETDSIYSVAIQNDQKIVTAGVVRSKRNGPDIAVARYNADGSLDTSFEGDGRVVTSTKGVDSAEAVRVQADQKIVVAGRLGNQFCVVRYNTNGSLDTSFGGTGKVTTDFGVEDAVGFTAAEDLAIQTDGKIIAGGWGLWRRGRGVDAETVQPYFLIARYNSDGSLDSTFGTGGKLAHDVGGRAGITKIAVQPDGKILAAGFGGNGLGLVLRFNSNGSLDTSYGNAGVVERPDLYPLTAALQSDGRIVLAGQQGDGIWVSRLDGNGNLDTTFAGMGTVQVFPTGRVENVLAQPDGKLVVVGTQDPAADFVVVRLNSDGTIDTTWGGSAAASASSSTLATTDSAVAPAPPSSSGSISALDAASVQQLLAEPDAKNTWTRRSRFKLLAL